MSNLVDQVVEDVEDQVLLGDEFLEVDKLGDVGINSADVTKLKNFGITTVKVKLSFLSLI